MSAGYVYAIGIEGTTLVKIGRARNVEDRLQVLQIGLPYRLTLLRSRWVEASVESEHMLLSQLQSTRVRGEWFDIPLEDVQRLFAQAMPRLPMDRDRPAQEMGKRIQAARERLHLSQSDLARALGKARQHVHLLEQGKQFPAVPLLRHIAQVLEVSTDYLVGLVDETNPTPVAPRRRRAQVGV